MTVTQFLLPGESVLYEAPDEVYYRRTPFALYVTGERLLLYAVTGRLSPSERAVAEPLAGVESVEYSERGLVSSSGRLDVRFPGHVLTLTGSPDTIKEVWRALQQHAPARGVLTADEEATLVVPPAPLFGDQAHPPAQVQPLGALRAQARAQRPTFLRRPSFPRRPLTVAALLCVASAVALLGLLLHGAARRGAQAPSQAAQTPAPAFTPQATPAPTPVTLQLMDELFTLEEGSHRAVRFSVPAAVASARVAGGFRVKGGDYVDFYLMRPEQYERFAAGADSDVSSVLYREQQRNAKVGERLTPGDYYLVFDNRDSEAGAQTVAAEFFLVLDQQAPR